MRKFRLFRNFPIFCVLLSFLNDSNIDFKGDAFLRLFRLITEANNCRNINHTGDFNEKGLRLNVIMILCISVLCAQMSKCEMKMMFVSLI